MAKKDIRDSIFSINGESRHGACIYSWIEKHGSKYVFWDVEKGRISDPCGSVSEAFCSDGCQYSLNFCEIYASISPEEMDCILNSGSILFSELETLRINGRDINTRDLNEIIEEYSKSITKKKKRKQG